MSYTPAPTELTPTTTKTASPTKTNPSENENSAIDEETIETKRKRIIDYSTNVKNYAKWFEINEVIKNRDKFTTYKVIYRFLPKDLNETAKELSVYKRYRDFKLLYSIMSHYHVSLHRRDKFPEFVRAKYFDRFDDKVIEERRQCSLRLLQFIGSQTHLYKHEKFIEFFLDANLSDHELGNEKNILKPSSTTTSPTAPGDNEWTLGDFDLSSNDFNSELKFISGILFDLNFNFKFCRVVSFSSPTSSCYLIKSRASTPTDATKQFILKCLAKSSSPNLDIKCQVPLSNQVPFMCKLIKYYESDTTIYLQLEYIETGRLVAHINEIVLTQAQSQTQTDSTNNAGHRPLSLQPSKHKYNNSFSCLSTFQNSSTSMSHQTTSTTILNTTTTLDQNKCQPTPLKHSDEHVQVDLAATTETIDRIEPNAAAGLSVSRLSSSSSSSSSSSTTSLSNQSNENETSNSVTIKLDKIASIENQASSLSFHLLNSSANPGEQEMSSLHLSPASSVTMSSNPINTSKLTWPLKFFSRSKENLTKDLPRALFQKQSSRIEPTASSATSLVFTASSSSGLKDMDDMKQSNYVEIKLNKYMTQIRVWLAQLLLALDALHKLDIVCKDLRLDNLLVAGTSNDLCLTYFSKWNLIDETLSKDSILGDYCAPELTGLVNYSITKACDIWSFGIIAFELLTQTRFSDLNSSTEIYVNSIHFPSDFECDAAKELIRKIIQLNPAVRPSIESIKKHRFFSNINWMTLENSYWIQSKSQQQ